MNQIKLSKVVFFLITVLFCSIIHAQSIAISYSYNPLELSPLLGADLDITVQYTSEVGSTGNHIYVGLEVRDANDNFISTVAEQTLENQAPGTNLQITVPLFIASYHKLSQDLPQGQYYQAKAILYISGTWTSNAEAGHWNTPSLDIQNTTSYNFSTNPLSNGADISWITEMEDNGYEWKDNDGNTTDIFQLLKEYNMNLVRLRVWVNPETSNANGWCDIDDLVAKAERAKNAGLDVMLTIHYSDWWADPGKQNKPQAWASYSVSQLKTAVANHTLDVLNGLEAKNIKPTYIQIGNETDDGMLWDTGKASTGGFANYAKFVNAGAEAVKNFDATIKTILHISNGFNNDLFKWNIDGLLTNGLVSSNIDVIGLSLYPDIGDWKIKVDETYDNMMDLQTRYQKEVMMVEVGHPNENYDVTYQFLVYMIEKTKLANGLGVLYWEPAVYNGWRSYSKGAWDDDGSPSVAMDAFKNSATLSVNATDLPSNKSFSIYPNPSNNSVTLSALNHTIQNLKIYDVHGKLVKQVSINSIQKQVDVSTLATGVYFFKADGFVVKFLKN